ncbi:hypothetical protein SVAN01_04913 [Stagonosporopsis vannaccii]|nr:hypothetical protein SVAN01_04913 [Stagonosporopsis vannaccii]
MSEVTAACSFRPTSRLRPGPVNFPSHRRPNITVFHAAFPAADRGWLTCANSPSPAPPKPPRHSQRTASNMFTVHTVRAHRPRLDTLPDEKGSFDDEPLKNRVASKTFSLNRPTIVPLSIPAHKHKGTWQEAAPDLRQHLLLDSRRTQRQTIVFEGFGETEEVSISSVNASVTDSKHIASGRESTSVDGYGDDFAVSETATKKSSSEDEHTKISHYAHAVSVNMIDRTRKSLNRPSATPTSASFRGGVYEEAQKQRPRARRCANVGYTSDPRETSHVCRVTGATGPWRGSGQPQE